MMESRQRPLDSPSSRPLHVLLSLITSTVVSTLETGIHTRTLLLSLIPSSRSTMESLLTLSILLTWMPPKFKETLLLTFQFTLPESELEDLLMDLDFLLESPRNSVSELRTL